MIQDKIFFDEKDPTGLSYNTPFTFYGSYQGRLYSKTPTGSVQYYTQNSDLSAYATTGSNQFSGSQTITGSLTVTGTITGTVAGTSATASYVEYTNVANKPALISGSSQVTYSGLTGVPSGIVSGSAQIADFGIFATTGSNGFNGSQSITGSLTVTGQVVAQTLNVQQVTSSIVYSSGSNIFGNSLSNTQQFTGSVGVTGSLAVAGASTFANNITATGNLNLQGAVTRNINFYDSSNTNINAQIQYDQISSTSGQLFFGTNNAGTFATRLTISNTGAATFSSTVSATQYTATSTGGSGLRVYGAAGTNQWDIYLNSTNLRFSDNTGTGSIVFDRPLSGTSATFSSTIAASGRISTSHSTSGDYAAVFYNTSATGEGVTIRGGSTSSHNALIVQPYNGATTLFSILATGAATFSGDVAVSKTGTYSQIQLIDNTASGSTWVTLSGFPALGDYTIREAGVANHLVIKKTTGAATFSSSVGVGAAPTGTYGTLSVSGGISIKNDNSAKLEIGRYSAGVSNSYIKLGPSSNSLRFTNNTDAADLFIIENGGNVGIGTTSPTGKLNVKGDIIIERTSNTENSTITMEGGEFDIKASPFNYATRFFTGTGGTSTERMRITSGGQVSIGTASPASERLTVVQTTANASALYVYTSGVTTGQSYGLTVEAGTNASDRSFAVFNQGGTSEYLKVRGDKAIFAQGVYDFTSSGGTAVYVDSAGQLYRFTSSLRYKKEIIDYTKGLSEVLQIKPKSFKSINSKEGEKVFAGLIAEQIDEIGLTEFVEYNDEGQPDAVHYSTMTALLIKAIQELKEQIDSLKNQIK